MYTYIHCFFFIYMYIYVCIIIITVPESIYVYKNIFKHALLFFFINDTCDRYIFLFIKNTRTLLQCWCCLFTIHIYKFMNFKSL